MSQRMTAASRSALAAADAVALVAFDRGFGVKVYNGERFGFLHGSESIMVYPDQRAARRAVRRHRPDLEPVIEA